ncbi:RNA-binding protein 8A, putative [Plasmodium vinckei vinckei]|uniref:RNA-binding protein 8A, putative n=5 Tax=Plasmodium vinckei TaxID=5860 RepID=A0A449BUQ8_PLAVN|nr:RNA-binding protein 8A, putative [Plasmodium vinckei vinckei]VEV57069.1 RNA-binding protein 8A, putative [Plasmodium vinckei vinckei]
MEDNYTNTTLNDDEVPAKSVEGWIIIITNIHGEAREDYIKEVFEEFGQIRNLHLNLDRRTGFIKGYAFLEFENFVDAKRAIDEMNGSMLLNQKIHVDWAFVQDKKKNG